MLIGWKAEDNIYYPLVHIHIGWQVN